jgi:predicted transcriptional regulator
MGQYGKALRSMEAEGGTTEIEVFNRGRHRLVKVYEILRCCSAKPLNMYEIGVRGHMSTARGNDDVLVHYLVSEGLLSSITPEEYSERGFYKRPSRKPRKNVVAYFEITQKGLNVVSHFNEIMDLLGLRKSTIRRFAGI